MYINWRSIKKSVEVLYMTVTTITCQHYSSMNLEYTHSCINSNAGIKTTAYQGQVTKLFLSLFYLWDIRADHSSCTSLLHVPSELISTLCCAYFQAWCLSTPCCMYLQNPLLQVPSELVWTPCCTYLQNWCEHSVVQMSWLCLASWSAGSFLHSLDVQMYCMFMRWLSHRPGSVFMKLAIYSGLTGCMVFVCLYM